MRLVATRDRERFIARRALRRGLLAARLGAAPEELRYVCNPYGKPRLAATAGWPDVCFSAASRGDYFLLAAVEGREIGADLELADAAPPEPGMLRKACSPRELAELERLPPERRSREFLRLWTRKESALKALGCGLGGGVDPAGVLESPAAVGLRFAEPDFGSAFIAHVALA